MEKNKSPLCPVIAGGVFVLLGILDLINLIRFGFSTSAAIHMLLRFVIVFLLFTKRRDVILPICFAILAIISLPSLLSACFNMDIFIFVRLILNLLADVGLMIICLGEFTDYIAKFYKNGAKKLVFIPAAILFLTNMIITPLLGIMLGITDLNSVSMFIWLEIFGYALVGLWAAYPDGMPKKVYNIISNESTGSNADNDADTDFETETGTDSLINSIYKCYCENVKRGLKAPATAVFCKPEELQIKEVDGTYIVSGWVDSQNSYGAMIRTNFTLKMQNENGKFVSKTNIHMLGSKHFASRWVAIMIFAIITTIILYFISYFFVNNMLF